MAPRAVYPNPVFGGPRPRECASADPLVTVPWPSELTAYTCPPSVDRDLHLGLGDRVRSGVVWVRAARGSSECSDRTHEELREIGIKPPERAVRVYRPEGCAGCNYTGYRGRVGIFELMQVDDDIRALVSQNIDSKTIKNKAVSKGMHTLRVDGAKKVLAGVTSVAEVLRATEEEADVAQI